MYSHRLAHDYGGEDHRNYGLSQTSPFPAPTEKCALAMWLSVRWTDM